MGFPEVVLNVPALAASLWLVVARFDCNWHVGGLGFAPVDYQQGNSYRIIYLHVPVAFLGRQCTRRWP